MVLRVDSRCVMRLQKITGGSGDTCRGLKQPWIDHRSMHQVHVYMGDDQSHFNNNQISKCVTTIGTLNLNVVKSNGTDPQENPINHNNLNKRTWSGIEIER